MLHAGPLLGVTTEWFGFLLPLFCAVVGIMAYTFLNLIGLNTDLIGLNTSVMNIE